MTGLPGLKIARKRNHMTQAQLAALIGCHELTIGRLERGKSGTRWSLIARLASVLGVSERDLLFPAMEVEEENANSSC